jgi:hypothetical protein
MRQTPAARRRLPRIEPALPGEIPNPRKKRKKKAVDR